MIDEIVYVIKTDFGFKGQKGTMLVPSVNRATFYQTYEMAKSQCKDDMVNPRVIKLQLKEVTE